MDFHAKYMTNLVVVYHLLNHISGLSVITSNCPDKYECVLPSSCTEAQKIEHIEPQFCGWFFEARNIRMVCCPPPTVLEGISRLSPTGCGIRRQASAPRIVETFYIEDSIREIVDAVDDMESTTTVQHLVVGGTTATVKWPWMVGIYNDTLVKNFICGGVLIDERHVLTAAHCFVGSSVLDPNHFSVHIGDIELSANNMYFEVEDIKIHQNYSRRFDYDDIAIILLAKSVPSDSTPVCLPNIDDVHEGNMLTVLGWGALFTDGPSPLQLQELSDLPVVDEAECYRKYRSRFRARFPKREWRNFICAGLKEGGKDACQGDSGGPLLRQDPHTGVWSLVGIVSSGFECAMPDNPGIYTRVASYHTWILDYIEKQNEIAL